MYPSFGRGFGGGNWLHGGTNRTIDYPKGDRFFAPALYTFAEFTVGTIGVVEASAFGGFMSPAAYSLCSFMEQRRAYLLNYAEPKKTASSPEPRP